MKIIKLIIQRIKEFFKKILKFMIVSNAPVIQPVYEYPVTYNDVVGNTSYTLNVKSRPTVPNSDDILTVAENEGYTLPYSCRVGQCTTCLCKFVSGTMPDQSRQSILSPAAIAAGYIAICVAYPKGPLEIITHQEDNYASDGF